MGGIETIAIANDRTKNIRDYVVFDLNAMNTWIIIHKIIVAQLEFKSMMFQMMYAMGQYSGVSIDDPRLHLRKFLEVASNFKIPIVTYDVFRLRLFLHPLRDIATSWLNSLELDSIPTRIDLGEKNLIKYFPSVKNANMMNEITKKIILYVMLGRDLNNCRGNVHAMWYLLLGGE